MPTWLIVTLVVLLALPGTAVVLAGVVALFFAPEPVAKDEPPADSPPSVDPAGPGLDALFDDSSIHANPGRRRDG